MASEAAAVFDMVAAAAAMAAMGVGTAMRIDEAVGDYNVAIRDMQARSREASAEAERKTAQTRTEGVMALKEQGAQSAHETRMALTAAEMTASAEEHRLGVSGVRAKGSPILAAQQNVDLAFAAAERVAGRGAAGMTLGGLRLGGEMADVQARSTLATTEYGRQQTEMMRKRRELQSNRGAMIAISVAGGMPGLATSFYNVGKAFDW